MPATIFIDAAKFSGACNLYEAIAMRNIIKRALSALLISVFTVQTCYCGDISSVPPKAYSEKLAPQTIFQKAFAPENSEEYRNSILSDMRLIGASMVVASCFLTDPSKVKDINDLGTTLRNKFRNDRYILDILNDNITLTGVRHENGIVYIPVKRDGRNYEVKVCTKKTFDSLSSRESQWCASSHFAIQAVEKAENPVRKIIPAMPLLQELSSNGDINYWDDAIEEAAKNDPDRKSVKILFERGENRLNVARFDIPSELLLKDNLDTCARYLAVSIYDTLVCEGATNVVIFMDNKELEKTLTGHIKSLLADKYKRMAVYANFGDEINISDSSNFNFDIHKELHPHLDLSPDAVKGKYYIGIDVGGTNIKTVIMYGNGKPIYEDRVMVDKNNGGVALRTQIVECAAKAVSWLQQNSGKEAVSLGLTFPSPIKIGRDGSFEVVRLTNFERFWKSARGGSSDFKEDYKALNLVADHLRDAVKIKNIAVLNDADAFGFGEIYNRIEKGIEPRSIGTKIVLPIGTGPGYVKIKNGYIENIPNQGGHMVIDLSEGANIDAGCEVPGCYGGYVPASAFTAMKQKYGLTEADFDNPSLFQKTSELLDAISEKLASEAVKLHKITGADEIVLAGGVSQKATGEDLSRRANLIILNKYSAYVNKVKVTVSDFDPAFGGATGAARYAFAFTDSLDPRNKPHWSMRYDLPATSIGKNNIQKFFNDKQDGKFRMLISRELFAFMAKMRVGEKHSWLEELIRNKSILFLDDYATPDALLANLSKEDFTTIIALGGGTLTDWAKFCGKKLNKETVIIPSTLSTNGMFTEKAIFYPMSDGKRIRDSRESGPPDKVIIDIQFLNDILDFKPSSGISGDRANRAGSGDLVSIYPALEDWKLAEKNGKEAIDRIIFDASEEILRLTSEEAEEMSSNSDLGMAVLSELMAEASLMNMRYGKSRPKDGSEHLLADRMDELLPAHIPRLHCEMVGIASIIMGYLYGNDYDRGAFRKVRDMVKRLGLPTDPAEIGLTKEIIVEALTSVNTRPDKYTFFDAPEGRITREEAQTIYERLFGSRQNEIDEFVLDINYYVNNSIKAMFEHINTEILPYLDSDKTKELIDLLLETKRLGGRVIINAAGRIGEVAVFFQQKLRALGFQVDDFKEITPEFLINENDLVLTFSGSGSTASVITNIKNVDVLHRKNKLHRRIFSITAKAGADVWKIGRQYHSTMVIRGMTKEDSDAAKKRDGAEYLPLASTFEYSTMLYLEGIVEALIQNGGGIDESKDAMPVRHVIEKTTATIKDELKEKLSENELRTKQFIEQLLSAIERNADGTIKISESGGTISRKRIYLFGLGQNNYVIRLFARRMQNIGFEVYVPGPRDIVSRPRKGDLAIFVSNSGARGQMEEKMLIAKERECPAVFITAAPYSPMANAADIVIPVTKRTTVSHTADIMKPSSAYQEEREVKRTFELASMFYLEGVSVALMKILGIKDIDLQHVPKEWELKGPEAPPSNPVIEKLIADSKMIEVIMDEFGQLKAYLLNYVDGYEPGITDPSRYRGPPVDIINMLNIETIAYFKEWLTSHQIDHKTIKFRIAVGQPALGWNDDIEHSNVAHAGERDHAIYIGEGLFNRLFAKGNELLRKEVLDNDEFRHLQGLGHGTPAEYEARLRLVGQLSMFNDTDEPLIGKGFKVEEVNNIKFTTSWQDSEEFVNMITDVERILKSATIYSELRASLLKAIVDFKKGRNGRQMGITPAFYVNPDRYRMCHGTNRSIGMSPEYFDKNSPFYEHRYQVFVHELFHSVRGRQRDDDDIEPDFHTDIIGAPAHVDAMRFCAGLFWGLDAEEVAAIQFADPTVLKKHPKNKLGKLLRNWKEEQRNLTELMARDDWKKLLKELRPLLKRSKQQMNDLLEFVISCDKATSKPENINYPIESRWPILRAVTLLDKHEQEKFADILDRLANNGLRNAPVVDSILLMEGRVPDNWLERLYPNLIGRHIWLASSEIWYPGGGLGRVMQFLAKAMKKLLGKYGDQLGTIEPEYQWRRDERGDLVPMDYKSAKLLTHPIVTELEEIDRFFIPVGDKKVEVIVRRGYNDLGIAAYFIRDKEGFYTHSLYNYNDGNHPELPTQEQFTEFISKATLEFDYRYEEKTYKQNPSDWKRPILHVNDSQFSLVSSEIMYGSYYDTDGNLKKYADNPLVQKIANAYTTHTYPDRNYGGGQFGLNKLDGAHVPADQRYTFERMDAGGEMVNDFTSNAIRRTRLLGGKVMGVSRNLVRDVAKYDDWLDYVRGKIVAVTNGADSAWTAKVFREIAADLARSADYKNIFPEEKIDYEYMTDQQISATRREAKKRLRLKDGQYFISKAEPDGSILNPDQETNVYIGRLVDWKCGRLRALTDENITKLIEKGVQVVIFGNVQHTDSSRMIADGIKALVERLKDKGPGKLVFVPSFDSTDQQCILAATDMGVVDSNPKREAAGGTETGFMSVGAVILAPPWPGGEGILVDQGIKFNFNIPGEGNILVPDITIKEEDLIQVSQKDSPLRAAVEKAYLDTMMNYLDLSASVHNMHNETSLRLDRVLKAELTAAENMRQYSMMITELEGPMANTDKKSEEVLATAGTVLNGLETFIMMPDFMTNKGVLFSDFMNKRMVDESAGGKRVIGESTFRREIQSLERCGIIDIDKTGKVHRIFLRNSIRNLSPPERKKAINKILAVEGLDSWEIKDENEVARIKKKVDEIILRHTLRGEVKTVQKGKYKGKYQLIETFANDEGGLFTEGSTRVALQKLQADVFSNTRDKTVAGFIDFMLNNPEEFARRFSDKESDSIIHDHYSSDNVKIIKKIEKSAHRTVREDVFMGLSYYLNNPVQFFSTLIKIKEFRKMIPTSVLARLVHDSMDRKGSISYARFPTIGSILDVLDSARDSGCPLEEGYHSLANGNAFARTSIANLLVRFAPEYAPPEIIKTPEERRMDRIYAIDMRLYSSVPVGKTLYKVLQVEHIPLSLRSKLIPMVSKLNRKHPELREKIEIVEGKDLINRVKELVNNSNNIVMTAVADEQYLKDLPVLPDSEKYRLRALVFTGDSQVECILAALRALYLGDANALRELYELASGNRLAVSDEDILRAINNPQELARKIIFTFKPIRVETQDMQDRLDKRLVDLIREAA